LGAETAPLLNKKCGVNEAVRRYENRPRFAGYIGESGMNKLPLIILSQFFSHERGGAQARTRLLRRAHRNILKGILRENFFKSFPLTALKRPGGSRKL